VGGFRLQEVHLHLEANLVLQRQRTVSVELTGQRAGDKFVVVEGYKWVSTIKIATVYTAKACKCCDTHIHANEKLVSCEDINEQRIKARYTVQDTASSISHHFDAR